MHTKLVFKYYLLQSQISTFVQWQGRNPDVTVRSTAYDGVSPRVTSGGAVSKAMSAKVV